MWLTQWAPPTKGSCSLDSAPVIRVAERSRTCADRHSVTRSTPVTTIKMDSPATPRKPRGRSSRQQRAPARLINQQFDRFLAASRFERATRCDQRVKGVLQLQYPLSPISPMSPNMLRTTVRIVRVSQIAPLSPADKRGTTDRVDRGTRCAEQRMC